MRMNSRVLGAGFWVLGALVAVPAAAQQPARVGDPSTSLTLYQDGRILVRRNYPVRVAQGASGLKLPLFPIDPASVVSLDSTVAITGSSTAPGLDVESALRQSVGRMVTFRAGPTLRDTISATLVGVDPV